MNQHEHYYVPTSSIWPIVGALGLFMIAFGAGHYVPEVTQGKEGFGGWLLLAGLTTIVLMCFGWFGTVIHESMKGLYSAQMDRSFRQGMSWFIFSEVMFFGAFFGALFYARIFAVPWLGGESNNIFTHELLWPDFAGTWPVAATPGGKETEIMPWQGLPLYNTIILLSSSVTVHLAHLSLEKGKRGPLKAWLGLTILLGAAFLFLQAEEYIHAYTEMGLTLHAGIYGNTFFMLTGFHGMHVTLGTLMLLVMWLRILKGHFSPHKHFGFMAASWYWHFVDVVWLCLFVFVYVL
ncbi:cytochrome c oxidase subunit 3 [Gallaecimonas xiamenensis]|uniref:cytochrome-c oxidase n=1 Tax=Gallaecimonas xiamenensis 3-C-1 TaxID=745411 RepID=K2JSL2_9GAMM|nr:cytochrome c oxidase subunit 3 [Gallaecimonas xiamenensis]EKE77492.1 cytochrome c oxidase subunit III [Gallaecimonas xiamenensis 3-C-1]